MRKKIYAMIVGLCSLSSLTIMAQNEAEGNISLSPDLSKSVAPSKVDGTPRTHIATDKEGNVYQFLRASKQIDLGESNTLGFGANRMVDLLIKYDAKGVLQWYRKLEGGERTDANAIKIFGEKIYLLGTHDNHARQGANDSHLGSFWAEAGRQGIAEHSFLTEDKEDEDLFVAIYDLNGNLQALKSIQSNKEALGRSETGVDLHVQNGKVYILGYSESTNSKGANPSYMGHQIRVGATHKFAFVFVLDEQNLSIEKVYSMKATDSSDLTLSSMTAWNGRIFVAGYSNAGNGNGKIVYNGNRELRLDGWQSLIYGELDLETNQFKQLRRLNDQGQGIMAYCLTAGERGVFIGGNAECDAMSLRLADGGKSEALKGAFLLQWDIEQEYPSEIYPLGLNHEENRVQSLALGKRGELFFALDYEGEFDGFSETMPNRGSYDSGIGLFDLNSGEVKSFYSFGSDGIDEIMALHYDKDKDRLLYTGYSMGSDFDLAHLDKIKQSGVAYYYAVKEFASPSESPSSPTAIQTLGREETYFTLGAGAIHWEKDSGYELYTIEGYLIDKARAKAGETLRLEAGVYILRFTDGKVFKLRLTN